MRSALVLTGAALAAVSGCVTVAGGQRPEGSGPPSPSTGPVLPERGARPRETPGPAREALVAVPGGTERPGPGAAPSPSGHGAPPPATRASPVTSLAVSPVTSLATAHPAPRRPPRERLPPPAARPGRTPAGAPGRPGADVCALGEAYGGWAPGGEPARTCREVYGD